MVSIGRRDRLPKGDLVGPKAGGLVAAQGRNIGSLGANANATAAALSHFAFRGSQQRACDTAPSPGFADENVRDQRVLPLLIAQQHVVFLVDPDTDKSDRLLG